MLPFSHKAPGSKRFIAGGFADVVKDDTVYELKFVSELSHEHFLQCACYVIALKLEKGILWNTRDNTAYEVRIPDKNRFLDAVANAITKNRIRTYNKPKPIQVGISRQTAPTVSVNKLSQYTVGTRVKHTIFGEGTIMNITFSSAVSHIAEIKFDKRGVRRLLLEMVIRNNMISIVSDDVMSRANGKTVIDAKKEEYRNGYYDVKDQFTQQEHVIRDRYKKRWVKCKKCGSIKQESDFVSYGGQGHINLGLCRECGRKQNTMNVTTD